MLRLDVIHRAVEAVDRDVARLLAHTSMADAPRMNDFQVSWGKLVELLALGPPPDASSDDMAATEPSPPRSIK
jgi:hypothetical protein